MNDVNLIRPVLNLVHTSEQSAARAMSSSQAGTDTRPAQLDDAVSQLNQFVQSVQRDLQFEVDNDLGQTIVKVVDQTTREVIRQIPDELAMKLAETVRRDEPLTLFDIKV